MLLSGVRNFRKFGSQQERTPGAVTCEGLGSLFLADYPLDLCPTGVIGCAVRLDEQAKTSAGFCRKLKTSKPTLVDFRQTAPNGRYRRAAKSLINGPE
jgi:hypothetical protein